MASISHQFGCLLLFMILVLGPSAAATNHLPMNKNPKRPSNTESMSMKHEQWMAKHERVYKDAAEKEYRFNIFKQNVEYIESANGNASRTYKLGLNKFSDLTTEEFRSMYVGGLLKPLENAQETARTSFRYANMSSAPTAMDWRERGAVTGIKNQGVCNCCWAFVAVAAMEGIIKIKTGKLMSLSEQELVDCDIYGASHGCNKGFITDAFKFIIENGGLTSEESYPYQAAQGACQSSASPVARISGYETLAANDERLLMQAVANQPVSVGIYASNDFQHYMGGVFSGPCEVNGISDLTHGVTVIGYGVDLDTGMKYWLAKNQWGEGWGEHGYIRMQKDIEDPKGLCGITLMASYPIA